MSEREFYSRQIRLKEVGEKGQLALSRSKVLVVGAGGLAHPCATYLAAAGIGRLSIIDFDKVELSNLNRQICFSPEDKGQFKAEILAEKLKLQNPFIEIESIVEKLNPHNAQKIVTPFDIVIDCCDNFSTKFLIHDLALKFKKNLIQASIYQYEGQLQVFPFGKSNVQGCLRCLWPVVPEKGCTQNCHEAGLIGAVAGVLGSMQAMECIKLILNLTDHYVNKTTTIDLLSMNLQNISWKKDDRCLYCSDINSGPSVERGVYESRYDFEIDAPLSDKMQLIDIREVEEIENKSNYSNMIHWPMSQMNSWIKNIQKDTDYLFLCSKGIRSRTLVKDLRMNSFDNCYSLRGGLKK